MTSLKAPRKGDTEIRKFSLVMPLQPGAIASSYGTYATLEETRAAAAIACVGRPDLKREDVGIQRCVTGTFVEFAGPVPAVITEELVYAVLEGRTLSLWGIAQALTGECLSDTLRQVQDALTELFVVAKIRTFENGGVTWFDRIIG